MASLVGDWRPADSLGKWVARSGTRKVDWSAFAMRRSDRTDGLLLDVCTCVRTAVQMIHAFNIGYMRREKKGEVVRPREWEHGRH